MNNRQELCGPYYHGAGGVWSEQDRWSHPYWEGRGCLRGGHRGQNRSTFQGKYFSECVWLMSSLLRSHMFYCFFGCVLSKGFAELVWHAAIDRDLIIRLVDIYMNSTTFFKYPSRQVMSCDVMHYDPDCCNSDDIVSHQLAYFKLSIQVPYYFKVHYTTQLTVEIFQLLIQYTFNKSCTTQDAKHLVLVFFHVLKPVPELLSGRIHPGSIFVILHLLEESLAHSFLKPLLLLSQQQK